MSNIFSPIGCQGCCPSTVQSQAPSESLVQEFATVQDMMESDDLMPGYARTLGFYKAGDGGAAEYKVVQFSYEDPNHMDVIKASKYICMLINYSVVDQLGTKASHQQDDSEIINYSLSKYGFARLSNKTYYTKKPIYLHSNNVLSGCGKDSVISNVGTSWNKNAVICGFVNGQTEQPNPYLNPYEYNKTGMFTFTCDKVLKEGQSIVFGSYDATGAWQKDCTACYITSTNPYTASKMVPNEGYLYVVDEYEDENNGYIPYYICNNAIVENISIKHLNTGSGMYCLWLCGNNLTAKNIYIEGNTAIASNFLTDSCIENINVTSYDGVIDIAEFINGLRFTGLNVTFSKTKAETTHKQFSIGRGNVFYSNVNVNGPIVLNASYTNGFMLNSILNVSKVIANNKLIIENSFISGTTTTFTAFARNSFFNVDSSQIIAGEGNVGTIGTAFANQNMHSADYKKGNYIIETNSYEITLFDHACKYTIYGDCSLNSASYTGVTEILLFNNKVRVINNGNIVTMSLPITLNSSNNVIINRDTVY